MKKVFLLVFTALAALMAASCQKEEMGRVLTATIERYASNDSKAYINDQYYACWENGDTVSINGTKYPVSVSSESSTATIMGTEGLEGDLLAYYPASQVTSWSGNNVTVTLPQVQQYRENDGHQVINNPMAAYCPDGGTELRFRNLAALLKVTIQAPSNEDLDLKAILVKGDDGQMLWGTTQLTLDNQNKPMLEKMTNGGASVSLSFPSTVTITAGSSKSFYIVVPAGSDFFNFTIVVATDQAGYRKVSKINQSLPRNHIGAITYTPMEEEKFHPIIYTGSIEGFNPNAFGGAQVVSSDGGVILFDRPLTSIGNYAFFRCSHLTGISLPEGVTSIGDEAFFECSSLTSISLPAGVTSIGSSAFSGCSSLASIDLPESLTSIGWRAFYGCSSLTSITLPAGVTSIGNYAFQNCRSLTSISLPESLTSIGNYVFFGCIRLYSISLPEGVTSIGESAFEDCSSLTSISLPESLTSIGWRAFYGCTRLYSISLPEGVTSIGKSAFYYCNSLTSISLPASLTSIGNEAFNGCGSLTSISLPAGVTSIGASAFSGCSRLARVDCYAIDPPSLGSDAFSNIHSRAVLHVPSNAGDYSSWEGYFRGGIEADL